MNFLLDDVAGGEEDSKEEASELVWFGPDQSGEDEFGKFFLTMWRAERKEEASELVTKVLEEIGLCLSEARISDIVDATIEESNLST